MKTRIPFSVTHPHLHAQRQQHLKAYDDTAGVLLVCIVGAPLLGSLLVALIYALMSL